MPCHKSQEGWSNKINATKKKCLINKSKFQIPLYLNKLFHLLELKIESSVVQKYTKLEEILLQ